LSRKNTLSRVLLCLVCALLPRFAVAQTRPDFKTWGLSAMAQIEQEYRLPARSLYADSFRPADKRPSGPAFMWACGVQLTALAAAARADKPHYLPLLRQYITGLDVYWSKADPVPGYDVLPGPKSPDRYYDDNEWVALALLEAYELTGDPADLDRAEKTFKFVMSGEDALLGGGLYWHEQEKKSKNTCSNGPAIVAALRLYGVTHRAAYLDTAKRLYVWTNAHLQDTDGLYWDNVKLDGQVEKTKFTYNTALMLRADALFYGITREKTYLDEAERVAKASEVHWFRKETGALGDSGMFAHHLCEAFFALAQQDNDPHWRDIVTRALVFVQEKGRDTDGHYNDRWDRADPQKRDKVGLLGQASVARAFLFAAEQPSP
jgi:mannose/cellobiose epimerase-like protein (N-acyl-D-glucosamine 2-epimerase family)